MERQSRLNPFAGRSAANTLMTPVLADAHLGTPGRRRVEGHVTGAERADGLGREAADVGDAAVGPVGVVVENGPGSLSPFVKGEGEPVARIRPDGLDPGVLVGALEEPDRYGSKPEALCSGQAVCAVDDRHRGAMDQNGRPRSSGFYQGIDVERVLTVRAWGEPKSEIDRLDQGTGSVCRPWRRCGRSQKGNVGHPPLLNRAERPGSRGTESTIHCQIGNNGGERGVLVNLAQLDCFLTIADELHFGRAAARLQVETSTLSKRLRDLESELGVRLFSRTTRRVALTPEGAVLVAHAERVVDEAATLRAVASASAAGQSGRVYAAYAPGTGEDMATLVRAVRRRYPDVTVSVEVHVSLEVAHAVHRGDVSFGICNVAPSAGPLRRCVTRDRHGQPSICAGIPRPSSRRTPRGAAYASWTARPSCSR